MSNAPFELTIRCGRFATRTAAEQEGKRILQDLKLLHLVDQPDACSIVVVRLVAPTDHMTIASAGYA